MNDEILKNYIQTTKFLKDTTKTQYLKRLEVIQTEIIRESLEHIMHNPNEFLDKVKDYIKQREGKVYEQMTNHSLDAFISAILALFIYYPGLREEKYELFQEWKSIHNTVKEDLNVKYKANQPTERQKLGYIDFEEIETIRDKLERGSIERLLLLMYTEIPPLRSDYGLIRIYMNEDDLSSKNNNENFIILSKDQKVLYINQYKTAKRYGTVEIFLPQVIVDEIKISLDINPREYLFCTPRGKRFRNSTAYNQWANNMLKRIFDNKKMNLTMFRHIYISRRDLELEMKNGLEQEKIAKIMGHSVAQQKKYSWHSWLENNKEDLVQLEEIPLKL